MLVFLIVVQLNHESVVWMCKNSHGRFYRLQTIKLDGISGVLKWLHSSTSADSFLRFWAGVLSVLSVLLVLSADAEHYY